MTPMKTFTLYPCHMDSTRTKVEGRKYNKKHCVEKPTSFEMEIACKKLQLEANLEEKKKHPRNQENPGRLVFKKGIDRYTVVAAIKQEITLLRSAPKKIEVKVEPKAEKKPEEVTFEKTLATESKQPVQKKGPVFVSKKKKLKEIKKAAKKSMK